MPNEDVPPQDLKNTNSAPREGTLQSKPFASRAGLRTLAPVLLALSALLAAACTHTSPATEETTPPVEAVWPSNSVTVEADGTVNVPAMAVPISEFLSPEAKEYLIEHLHAMQTPEMLEEVEGVGGPMFLKNYIDRQKELFPVVRTDTEIAGVEVYDYTPAAGISPGKEDRVLINLHGGGFMTCWPACGELESMPVSALGGYRIVSINYRQFPEYRFPAASEDVAKVYAELLKTYKPEKIGIFGCSAGGMLTGMSLAWFQKEGLPTPGAAGIYCAGSAPPVGGFGGDANYTATAIGEARFMAPPPSSEPAAPAQAGLPYLHGADLNDPLVAPAVSDDVLSRFPPTQFITGTRSFELSSAVYTHSQLVRLGVEADLHVWEGMFHGFYTNPDVPESREAYNVMIKFFDKHLAE